MKFLIFIGLYIFCVCETIFGQCRNCGIMIMRIEVFDSIKNTFVANKGIPSQKIYFKDSIIIIPSMGTISNEVNGKETSYEEKELYFTYINIRSKKNIESSSYSKDSLYFSKYEATYYEYPT